MMKLLPKARNSEIVVQELGRQLLIYDLRTHQAYQLNETSHIVFNACDGKTSFTELKSKYGYPDEIIYLALDKLQEQNLLESEYVSLFAGMKRRDVIKKVGLASLVALPLIVNLVAPPAAHAASGRQAQGARCTASTVCAPGNTCTATSNGNSYCCDSGTVRVVESPGAVILTASTADECAGQSGNPHCCTKQVSFIPSSPNSTFGSCRCSGTP